MSPSEQGARRSGSRGVVRVLRNFSWLAGGQLTFRLIFLALVVLLARSVPVEDYAILTLLLVYGTVWAPLFNFGLGIVGVREMAKGNVAVGEFMRTVLPLKLAVSAAGCGGMIALGALLGYGARDIELLVLMAGGTVVVSLAEFFHLPFSAREEMQVTAGLTVLERAAVAVGAAGGLLLGLGARGFAYGYLLGAVAGATVAVLVWGRRLAWVRPRIAPHVLWWYVRESLPVAVTWFLAIGYGRVGLFVLERYRGDTEVAVFNTALLVVVSVQQGVTVLMHAAFPALSQAHKGAIEALRQRLRRVLGLALPASVALTGLLLALSTLAVPLVLGREFALVPDVLAVLLWVLPLFSLNALLGTFLQAGDRQTVVAWIMAVGLLANLFVSVPLAIALGARGVALGTAIAEAAILATFAAYLTRREPGLLDGRILRSLVIVSGGLALVVTAGLLAWAPVVRYGVVVVLMAALWLEASASGQNPSDLVRALVRR